MAKPTAPQRWVLVSDMHVGSSTGLLPDCDINASIPSKLLDRWRDCVAFFSPRPNVVVCNGDAIDGVDRKGHDVVVANRADQARMAAELLAEWAATDEYVIITGTPYHTDADGESMEELVAAHLRAMTGVKSSLRRKLKTTVNKWFRLEMRHKIGSSTVPYGRSTAPAKAKVWNNLNAVLEATRSRKPVRSPHFLAFGHVHYYTYQEDAFGAVCTIPCWQALGSRHGDEACDGHVDIGACQLTIGAEEDDSWEFEKRLYLAGVVERWEHR